MQSNERIYISWKKERDSRTMTIFGRYDDDGTLDNKYK